MLAELGRHEDGLKSLDQALALKPDYAGAHLNRGNMLAALGRTEEAVESYERAISLQPDFGDAYFNQGNMLAKLGRYAEALTRFEHAARLNPDLAEAHLNKGHALLRQQRHQDALDSIDLALGLNPAAVNGWVNKGVVLQELKQMDAAIACFNRAILIDVRFAAAYINRAAIFQEQHRPVEAVVDFDKAFELAPKSDFLEGARMHAHMVLCDWKNYESNCATLSRHVAAGQCATPPFAYLALPSTAQEQFLCAQIYARKRFPEQIPLWHGEIYAHEKIRIAYVSADFHNHATAHLMAGLFEIHDRKRFQLTAISFSPDDGSPMQARLRDAFDEFIDVSHMNDGQIAHLIHEKEIDIGIDLKGFTQDARVNIFAYRPAPVQVNYLGYPGTMGASYMDYIIADRTVIPPEHEAAYTEKVVCLPATYQVNDSKRGIDAVTPTRSELGLPEKAFVFCCFNNNHKITPEIFAVWMSLLQNVDGSVLWLLEPNAPAIANLRAVADKCGIAPERLIFAPRMSMEQHLARHRQADLFLDTIYYNAHTTASDALWSGLPVLTCLGDSFAGRVAASLLKAAGLPELVTSSLEEYEQLALKLAREPALLATLKEKLLRQRDACALFDTRAYVRQLEMAFTQMHARAQAGGGPAAIILPDAE